jgi:hypothetical protein
VLFQSLDVDGNPANGIVVPAAAAAAITSSLDLTAATAVFASAANTVLVNAQAAGGIHTGIVTPVKASASFLAQALTILSTNVWTSADATTFAAFRVNSAGQYIQGQANPPSSGGTPGVETGTITAAGFDPAGWFFAAPVLNLDTNGQWGLSNPAPCERLVVNGSQLLAKDCAGNTTDTVGKMDNDPAGIVGAWAVGSASDFGTEMLLFFSNGRFAVLDPVGDTHTPSCGAGGKGVEFGSYTYDPATKLLKVSALTYNTDGCAGLSGTTAATAAGLTFTLGSGASTATFNDGTARTAYRVSN